MSDSIIGLHFYSVTQHHIRNETPISHSQSGDGARLRQYFSYFQNQYSNFGGASEEGIRYWFLRPQPTNGFMFDGHIMYGSTGFTSDIVDRTTHELNYERKISDIDIIPLYYSLWIPDGRHLAILAIQTFGQRSCVGRIQRALVSGFREANSGFILKCNPIMPSSIERFKDSEVKTINLVKRDVSSDDADNQLIDPNTMIDLNITFNSKRKSNFGRLIDVIGRMPDGDKNLQYNDTQFDEATADVLVGGKRRKITLVGMNQASGKIDITDSIDRSTNGHPSLDSIRAEVIDLMTGIGSGNF